MAHWVLQCPHCSTDFNHSEIQSIIYDHFMGTEVKPKFPDGGLSIACPHCQETSLYQRYQLIYGAH